MAVDAPPVRPATLAVVVSAGVSTYLPRTLAAVAAQTHAPDVVVVVDVGAPGRDLGTGVPVHEAVADAGLERVSRVRVVRAPAATTFGEAVRQGLVAYGGSSSGPPAGPASAAGTGTSPTSAPPSAAAAGRG